MAWKFNPFTRNFDYYEVGGGGGVTDHNSLTSLGFNASGHIWDGDVDFGANKITVPLLEIDNNSTYIDKDGSGNMIFSDAIVGTRTLKQLGCPTMKTLESLGQTTGSLNLTDINWNVSKAWLKNLKIQLASGTSTNYEVGIYEKDTFSISTLLFNIPYNNGDMESVLDYLYQDKDSTDELHIKIIDNDGTGSPVFDIYLRGIELL